MIRVGKIAATHGLSGALIMTHVVGDSKWLKKGVALMVEMLKGSFIPYFVAEVKTSGDKQVTLTLEEVAVIDHAKRLVGKSVYVSEDILTVYAAKSPLLWIGFAVTDVNTGVLGIIEDVMQTTSQWLCKVIYKDKEVLIPLIDQFIRQIDLRKKRLVMELPEGLLDVYTA